MELAVPLVRDRAGKSRLARIAITAITTSNSINVKPVQLFDPGHAPLHERELFQPNDFGCVAAEIIALMVWWPCVLVNLVFISRRSTRFRCGSAGLGPLGQELLRPRHVTIRWQSCCQLLDEGTEFIRTDHLFDVVPI